MVYSHLRFIRPELLCELFTQFWVILISIRAFTPAIPLLCDFLCNFCLNNEGTKVQHKAGVNRRNSSRNRSGSRNSWENRRCECTITRPGRLPFPWRADTGRVKLCSHLTFKVHLYWSESEFFLWSCCHCSINTKIGNNVIGWKRRRFRFCFHCSINEPLRLRFRQCNRHSLTWHQWWHKHIQTQTHWIWTYYLLQHLHCYYRSGTFNSKLFFGQVFLLIKWNFESTVHFKNEMIRKDFIKPSQKLLNFELTVFELTVPTCKTIETFEISVYYLLQIVSHFLATSRSNMNIAPVWGYDLEQITSCVFYWCRCN